MEKCNGFFEELNRLPRPEKLYRQVRELSTIAEVSDIQEEDVSAALTQIVGEELSDLLYTYQDRSYQPPDP